jgi:hypothetical protein
MMALDTSNDQVIIPKSSEYVIWVPQHQSIQYASLDKKIRKIEPVSQESQRVQDDVKVVTSKEIKKNVVLDVNECESKGC